jgi:hypothetical protein
MPGRAGDDERITRKAPGIAARGLFLVIADGANA